MLQRPIGPLLAFLGLDAFEKHRDTSLRRQGLCEESNVSRDPFFDYIWFQQERRAESTLTHAEPRWLHPRKRYFSQAAELGLTCLQIAVLQIIRALQIEGRPPEINEGFLSRHELPRLRDQGWIGPDCDLKELIRSTRVQLLGMPDCTFPSVPLSLIYADLRGLPIPIARRLAVEAGRNMVSGVERSIRELRGIRALECVSWAGPAWKSYIGLTGHKVDLDATAFDKLAGDFNDIAKRPHTKAWHFACDIDQRAITAAKTLERAIEAGMFRDLLPNIKFALRFWKCKNENERLLFVWIIATGSSCLVKMDPGAFRADGPELDWAHFEPKPGANWIHEQERDDEGNVIKERWKLPDDAIVCLEERYDDQDAIYRQRARAEHYADACRLLARLARERAATVASESSSESGPEPVGVPSMSDSPPDECHLLLDWLEKQPGSRVRVIDVPEHLKNADVFTICDSEGLIEFATLEPDQTPETALWRGRAQSGYLPWSRVFPQLVPDEQVKRPLFMRLTRGKGQAALARWRLGRDRGRAPPQTDDAPQGTPAKDAEVAPCQFRRDGDGWYITFEGAGGHFEALDGFAYIHQLFTRRRDEGGDCKPIGAIDMVRSLKLPDVTAERSRSIIKPHDGQALEDRVRMVGDAERTFDQEALNNTNAAIKETKASIAEVERAIEEGNATGDEPRAERLRRDELEPEAKKLEQLEQARDQALGLGGRPRRLGTTDVDKARQTVRHAIRAACKRLVSAEPQMTALVEHVKRSIPPARGGCFVYSPETAVDWRLD